MTADRRRDAFIPGAVEGPGSDPTDCALVISSCDKYQDLWGPSLALHRRFWPDCPYPTFLMSETVPVEDARVRPLLGGARLTWSGMALNALRMLPHEEIHMLMLNGKQRPIGMVRVAQGGLHGAAITARDILRPAIAAGATAFLIAHNHPSGDPKPSDDDIVMTRHIAKATEVVGVGFLDHLIVCPERGSWSSILEFVGAF